jgi:hypothetical protein
MKIMPVFKWLVTTVLVILCWPVSIWRAKYKRRARVVAIGIIPLSIMVGMLISDGFILEANTKWYWLIATLWYSLTGVVFDVVIADIYNSDGFLEFPKLSNLEEE